MISPHRGRNCKTCHRPLRIGSETQRDHPGTIKHDAHGMCVTCTGRIRKAKTAADLASMNAPYPLDVPLTVNGLDSDEHEVRLAAISAQQFLDDRRKRGVPAEGIRYWERAA